MIVERVTERLLALDSVRDCKAVLRFEGEDAAQASDSGRIVAYVVPASSVRTDRLEEWVASLRTHCLDGEGAGPQTPCDLIAVSRLPLAVDGRIDDAMLFRQPVVDTALVQRWQGRLENVTGVRDAMVKVMTEQEPLPGLHFADLFPDSLEWENGHEGGGKGKPAAAEEGPLPETPSRGALRTDALPERRPAFSYGGDIEGADELPRVLGETLQRAAQRYPHHGLRTIVDGAEQFLPYPELLTRADHLLTGLRRAGLSPGDRVILQFANNQAFLVAFWACVLGGFVPTPLAPSKQTMGAAAEKLQHAWKILDASMVLTSRDLLADLRAMLASQGIPEGRAKCIEELATSEALGEWHMGAPSDLALMMLTSGSTGVPKAVMLTHRNLIRRSAGSVQRNGFSSDAITLSWMPLDHVAGLVYFHLRDVFLGCQQIHATTDLVTQDPLIWPEWIDRYRVTITFAPNFAFGLVNDRAEQIASRAHTPAGVWDLSCLCFLLNGAEAIVSRTARRFLQIFAPYGLSGTAMWPVWGMSETSSGTLYSEIFRLESTHDDDPFVEVGRPIPGLAIRIVDEQEHALLEGETGRLEVTGDQVTPGYYNRPDLNAEAFTSDGWFKTGDLGVLSQGRLTITGREKDVIVINSIKYACHEIESVVEEVDGVETSFTAACAVRDADNHTDRLAIFFHPVAGVGAVSPELIRSIRSFVSRRLGVSPDYLLPVERDAIAKTSIGKIQRTQLANSFREGVFGDVVRRVEVLMGRAKTLPDWFFQPVWKQARVHTHQATGPTLVFADGLGVGESLQRSLLAVGCPCVLVLQGSIFSEECSERFTIDPGNGDHYARLLDVLRRRNFDPESVVHLWTYCEDLSDPYELQQIEHAQTTGLLSLLRLAQALGSVETSGAALAPGRPKVRLTVVSNRLQQMPDDAGAPAFEKAPVLGLLKTIPQEQPQLACYHLDLPLSAAEKNASLVFQEIHGRSRGPEVAYRAGSRWVRRVQRSGLTAESARPLPIEKGGLYLVSGGLGGIGLELARYLLRYFRANLILIGRTELASDTADRSDALRSLETLAATHGGRAMYAAVDAVSVADVQKVVAEAEALCSRPLAGVFHLAGTYHECPVTEETADGLAAVLHPKLGAVTLHALLANRPGALFVSFSSVNGFWGGYGVSAYAAANAFLESFAEFQRAATKINAFCVSWSLWDDVGMSRGYARKDAARTRGFYAISARQGLLSLLAILQRSPGHTLVGLDGANLHVRGLAEDLPVSAQTLVALVAGEPDAVTQVVARSSDPLLDVRDRYGNPSTCRVEAAPEAVIDATGRIDRRKGLSVTRTGAPSTASPVGPGDAMERTISRVWGEILGLEQFNVTDNFFDLGGSSLRMGQVNGRLQEILGRKISMTETFQYPSVRLLAAYLSGPEKAANAPELGSSQSRGARRRDMVRARRR